ncbi:MAG: zinc-ribbon domain-containing protein [Gemmatimonadota bacterium]
MSLAAALAATALTLLCLVWVGYPLVTSRARPGAWRRDRLRLQLAERKEALYAAIVELEFDRDVGKLPEEDCQRQRRGLEGQALEVLAQLEGLDAGGEEAALRARIEGEVAALRSVAATGRCPTCGAAVGPSFRFCPGCGAALGSAPAP